MPSYMCMRCRVVQSDEPPWERIMQTKGGALFVRVCNTCLLAESPKEKTGMSMTKQHYIAIAEAVAETVLDPDERSALANRLGAIFKDDNALFNPILFRNAADAVRVKEE